MASRPMRFKHLLSNRGLLWHRVEIDDDLRATVFAAWGNEKATHSNVNQQIKKVLIAMIDGYEKFKYDDERDVIHLEYQQEFLEYIKKDVLWVRCLSNHELSEFILLFIEARNAYLERQKERKQLPGHCGIIASLVQQFIDLYGRQISMPNQPYKGPPRRRTKKRDIIPFSSDLKIVGKDDKPGAPQAPTQRYVRARKGPFIIPLRPKAVRQPENKDK